MSDISTRIWLDERLWDEVRRRAIREGVTARELIPRLLKQATAASGAPAKPALPAPSPAPVAVQPALAIAETAAGPPVVPMAELYRCGVCGAEVRLGGLSQHINRHLKEAQAAEAERS